MTAFIIVTYNGEKWINRCISSIYDLDSTCIVVVDNASTDRTTEIIESEYPECVLERMGSNLGFGQANNHGIKLALERFQPDSFFLINQDVYLNPGCLETIRDQATKTSEYAILSPVHYGPDNTSLESGFSFHLRDVTEDFTSDEVGLVDVPFVNAAGWFISSDVFEKFGGFDPVFFHYGEDDNMVSRIMYHGLKVGVVTGASLIHDREQGNPKNTDLETEWRLFLIRATNPSISLAGELNRSMRRWLRLGLLIKFTLRYIKSRAKLRRSRAYAKSPPNPYLYIRK